MPLVTAGTTSNEEADAARVLGLDGQMSVAMDFASVVGCVRTAWESVRVVIWESRLNLGTTERNIAPSMVGRAMVPGEMETGRDGFYNVATREDPR